MYSAAMVENQQHASACVEGGPEHMVGAISFKGMYYEFGAERRAAIHAGPIDSTPFYLPLVLRKPFIVCRRPSRCCSVLEEFTP